ncbi:hypothetical protein CLAIMM_14298 [Cladophialophora immunda]|nr:hypothetical protein CLAIMM_14298 [Cladophialophora immunda]
MTERGGLPKDYFVTSIQYTRKTFQDVYPAIDPRKSSNSLAGKIVVITGASRGIGAKGIVPSFAIAGARGLVLIARDEKKLRAIEAEVRGLNPAVETLVVALDITHVVAVEGLFLKIKEKFGRYADVLVNNAALNAATNTGGPVLHEAPLDEWWSNFEVNVKGFFILTKYFISSLPAPTTPVTIINISTSGAWLVYPIASSYCISKLAAFQWAVMVNAAYNGSVNVISIHPGMVDTDMQQDFFRDFDLDNPMLAGGVSVWAAADSERSSFLSGRIISANWDVEELLARRSEIENGNQLRVDLVGQLGKDQFESK